MGRARLEKRRIRWAGTMFPQKVKIRPGLSSFNFKVGSPPRPADRSRGCRPRSIGFDALFLQSAIQILSRPHFAQTGAWVMFRDDRHPLSRAETIFEAPGVKDRDFGRASVHSVDPARGREHP